MNNKRSLASNEICNSSVCFDTRRNGDDIASEQSDDVGNSGLDCGSDTLGTGGIERRFHPDHLPL